MKKNDSFKKRTSQNTPMNRSLPNLAQWVASPT